MALFLLIASITPSAQVGERAKSFSITDSLDAIHPDALTAARGPLPDADLLRSASSPARLDLFKGAEPASTPIPLPHSSGPFRFSAMATKPRPEIANLYRQHARLALDRAQRAAAAFSGEVMRPWTVGAQGVMEGAGRGRLTYDVARRRLRAVSADARARWAPLRADIAHAVAVLPADVAALERLASLSDHLHEGSAAHHTAWAAAGLRGDLERMDGAVAVTLGEALRRSYEDGLWRIHVGQQLQDLGRRMVAGVGTLREAFRASVMSSGGVGLPG